MTMNYFIWLCSMMYMGAMVAETIYGLHMFQQNSYKNSIHGKWLWQNKKKFLLVYLLVAMSFLTGFFCNFVTEGILVFMYALVIYNLIKIEKSKTKKKLVYTQRVKRLLVTQAIVQLLFLAIVYTLTLLLPQASFTLIVLALAMLAAPYSIMLINTINSPMEKAIQQYYIKDAKKMLQAAPDLQVIGITGSYGKTSVKFYLDALLKTRFHVLTTPESYNTPMGVVKTIRESLNPLHEIFICEMGAKNLGDIKELCDIVHPHHGVITSIGPQHLESFKNMDNILKTKFELADSLPSTGKLFLNGDNNYINDYVNKYKEYPNIISYKTDDRADGDNVSTDGLTDGGINVGVGYIGKIISVSRKGTIFLVTTPQQECRKFETKLIGSHNVINLVGAIAIAHSFGIPLEELLLPVRKISPVEHRLQLIERGNITIIDDAYNSNPTGAKAALDTLALFQETRILVTPGMIELGSREDECNYEFGQQAAAVCQHIILVGKKQTMSIAKGVLEAGFDPAHLYIAEDLQDAMNHAYLVPGENAKVILLENDLPDNY